jgi:ankyrin repeat protein
MLIKARANIETQCKKTPLWIAVKQDNIEIVEMLIKAGANIEAQASEFGATPLHVTVVTSEDTNILKRLIDAKANLDARTEITTGSNEEITDEAIPEFSNLTPLHVTTRWTFQEDTKALDLLLAAGAKVNEQDSTGRTALHMQGRSCGPPAQEIAKALIDAGADLEIKTNDGLTSLHYAIAHEAIEAAIELIKAGANINAKDNDGLTPIDYINDLEEPNAQKILNDAIANRATTNALKTEV